MNYATIRLVSIGRHASRPDWKLGPQSHEQHEIIVIESGRQSAEMEGATHTVGAGDVLWFPQNVPHTEQTDPADPVRSLFLSVDWPELPRPPALRITDTDGRIGQLARWLYAERERDPAPDRPIATALTQAIVAEYLRLATQPADPLIAQVRKFMRQHYRRPITLDDLARTAGYFEPQTGLYRPIGVATNGTGYAQVDAARSNVEVVIGNVVTCDQPQLRILVTQNTDADGQPTGRWRVEVFNPTDRAVEAKLAVDPAFSLIKTRAATTAVPRGGHRVLELE